MVAVCAVLGILVLALAAAGASAMLQSRALTSAFYAQLYRGKVPAEIAGFYEGRGFRPFWLDAPAWRFWRAPTLRPEAAQLAAMTRDPKLPAALDAARSGRPDDLARAELALSIALGRYVEGLSRTSAGEKLAFIEPDLAQPTGAGARLAQAAAAPSLSRHLAALASPNPVHAALLKGLATYRATWSKLPQIQLGAGPTLRQGDAGERVLRLRERLGLATTGPAADRFDPGLSGAVRHFQSAHALPATGEADPATIAALNRGAAPYEALILKNLERARLLPPPIGRRFLLVNPASGELSLYEDGEARDAMKVVVGSQREQTPMMAGLMRHLVYNPYWYVPVDMTREAIAPRVLASNGGYIQAARLETLSDWTDEAVPIDPAYVDWDAVATGALEVRVRQKPGGDNMMGQVKFMLPNELGIYLHDTPDKGVFAQAGRLLSAGCVRLERAHDLAAWLMGRRPPYPATLGPDTRFDLRTPVTVYISYLTAAPGPGGVAFHPDVYGRDARS